MKCRRRALSVILALALLLGSTPLVEVLHVSAASGVSLDVYERDNYLKPDSTPMEATPTVLTAQNTSLTVLPSTVQSLDGSDWEMVSGGTQASRLTEAWSGSIAATVPASIHTNLVKAGLLEDPYVALNDAAANAESSKTWWMKKEFTYSGNGKNVRLNFEGVCDRMTVWLNGTQVGSHQGMFGGPYIDVTDTIVQGKNTLIVRLDPALAWKDTVVFCCSYGWHYAKIRPLGIWNSVSVEDVAAVEIVDPFIATKDAATGTMDVSVELKADAAYSGTLKLRVTPKNFTGTSATYTVPVSGAAGSNTVRLQFAVPNPRLWWPNGYGEQNLYRLEVGFETAGGNAVDYDETTFGIRTIEMAPTPAGESQDAYNWTFVVNGKEIFMKGTGWCTTDALMRFDEASYDAQLKRAREQGIGLLRAWGGGMPETETFYDLCDEYGLCVYQEWPLHDESHNSQPSAVLYETVELNVRRLRNRASLIMWGGGNECDAELENTVINTMGKLTLENDGTRPWHRQDPYGKGSSHNYNTYWGGQQLDRYLNVSDTFLSEFGLPSMPNIESLRKYASEEELNTWPIASGSSLWHHTPQFGNCKPSNGYAIGDIAMMSYFADEFIALDSVESFVIGTQLAQAVGIRHTIENTRTLWPNSTGICYYKLNDVYPGASWSTVDWYGAPKMSYYFLQDAYQSLCAVGIVKSLTSYGVGVSIPIWLLDDTDELAGSDWTVSARAYDGNLSLLREVRYTGSGSIDRTRKLGSLDLSAAQTATAPLFIVTDVIKDGTLAARNYFFINYSKKIGSLFTLPTTTLQYTKSGNVYTVKNTGSVPAVAANLTLSDSTTVSLSDNYVWLEPGETKKITVTSQTGGDGTAFITGVDGFNLRDGNEPVAPDRPTALSARFTANNTLTVTFDEPLDKTSAETIANYRLDGDAAVTAASLGADGVTVTLTVTAGSDKDHTLTVSGVCDRDKNAMVKQTFFVSRGLIGYWQFDEGGGTAVKDGTGNTPDMTVSGPTYETAPEGLGTAMSFNKNKVTGLSSLTLGNHFTISMFMKASSSTPGWGAIFSKGPKAAGHFEFNFDTYNTRNLEFYAPDLSSSGFDSGAKLADDKWHHVGVTLANGTLTMYVDGAAVKTFTGLTGSIAATTEELVFGGLAGYNGTYIGLLDEVRVYDYALSAARMAELAHVYETPCDMTCSVCGGTRTVPHDYSGACDTTCNICGAARLASAAHTYGSNGDACTVCGAELSYETADRADIVDGKVMEVTKTTEIASSMQVGGAAQSVPLTLGACSDAASSYLRYEFLLSGVKADSSVTVSLKAGNVSFDAAAAILAAEGLTAWKDGFYAGAVPFAALFGSADVSALTFDSLTVSVAGGGVLRIDALDAVVYGKTVVAGTKTPQFNILGASVRGENDIRFGLQIDDRYWNAGSQITAVSFGAIVVPTALLGGELTLESADVLRIKTEKWQLGIVDADGAPYAGDVYTAVVLDVPDMDTQLTARGYMVFVADGVEYVTYTAPVTRTIREVYAAAGIDPGAAA